MRMNCDDNTLPRMFMVCSDRLVDKKNEYFIAYYNGSNEEVVLKVGERIGYCMFVDAERECSGLGINDSIKDPVIERLGKWERFKNFLFRNANIIVPSMISIIGIIVSIILGGN